jgi:hypothetical protein
MATNFCLTSENNKSGGICDIKEGRAAQWQDLAATAKMQFLTMQNPDSRIFLCTSQFLVELLLTHICLLARA